MRNQQKLELIPTLPKLSVTHNALKIRHCELKLQEITYIHFHSTFELGMCISGEGTLLHAGEEYPFSKGDIQMVFPYTPHINRTTSRESCIWIWASIDYEALFEHLGVMNFSLINQLISRSSKYGGIIKKEAEPRIYEKTFSFLTENSNGGFPDLLHMAKSFLDILITASDEAEASGIGLPASNDKIHRLAPALKRINLDIESGENTSVDELARLCAMSATGFRNSFIELIGTTPKSYIQACRIRRAKYLIRHGGMNILDIAYSVGYKNISGFNRAFLDITGETPSDYRKRRAEPLASAP